METLGLMKLFENMTHSKIKDCIIEPERIIFIVQDGELRQALGKGAENIKKLSEKFKKRVKIVEFKQNMLDYIKNFVHPNKLEEITEAEGIVTMKSNDTKTRGLLIGRAAKNLRALESYVKRDFPNLKEIKVV